MNVLSLFDGISCGQLALQRAGIEYDNYYASEIDKYAIKVTQINFPNTIQIGGVTKVSASGLPAIDLLIGGSPCQGFSFAGKQLNFEDERSKLFFEYIRLKNELQPKYFLLENVKMQKKYEEIISEYMGVKPILINSKLVSGQNRERMYWTNIPITELPADKGIFLKDVLEDGESVRGKSQTLLATLYKENAKSMVKRNKRGLLVENTNEEIQGAALRNQKTSLGTYAQLNVRKDGKSNCVVPSYTKRLNGVCRQVGVATDVNGYDLIKRVYDKEGKAPSLTTMQGGHRQPKVAVDYFHYRKLTPLECERLQTIPDNFTNHVSASQRYKMIGNGWTIDVIAHIFKELK